MSYDLSDLEIFGREFKVVKVVRREMGWKKVYVINWDIEKEVDGIKLIFLWRFLFEEDY